VPYDRNEYSTTNSEMELKYSSDCAESSGTYFNSFFLNTTIWAESRLLELFQGISQTVPKYLEI
jgi:hypothetical protein